MNANQSGTDTERDRIRAQTHERFNRRIDDRTQENIYYYSLKPSRELSNRIAELDREWDVERWIACNSSWLALTGLLLGMTMNRKWLLLPATMLSFQAMHSVRGWCPPVPLLRRFGVRTRGEIDREKYALKYFRGDFSEIKSVLEQARSAIAAYKAAAK